MDLLYRKLLPVFFALLIPAGLQASEDPHAHHRAKMQGGNKSAIVKVSIPEIPMFNQHGKKVSVKDDIIGDRIAVVSFAYTSCTTVCPVVTAIFSQLQDKLKNEMKKDVALVTITVDPARDTSERLLAYAQKHGAKAGWSWLTGNRENVTRMLSAFGAYTAAFEDHPAMMLIGDMKKNQWFRYYGFSSPDTIKQKVSEMMAARAG